LATVRLSRAALTTAVVLALAAAPLSSATAAPDDPPAGPTRADVRAARQVAATRADQVGQIQAQLARAQERLQRVQVASMQATEAYNGAVYRLQQARKDAAAAHRRAARAERAVERQRRALEGFAVGSSSDATSLADLNTVLSAGGPEELLEDYGAWSDTTSALQ
jgi:peptidoglycan DL-endopeptidase CwlO